MRDSWDAIRGTPGRLSVNEVSQQPNFSRPNFVLLRLKFRVIWRKIQKNLDLHNTVV